MYFANKGNPSYAGIAQVSCSDGGLQTYSTTTNFQITGNKLKLKISDSGNTIYFSGSIFGISNNNFCIWSTTSIKFDCHGMSSSADGISLYSNSDDWIYALFDFNAIYFSMVINSITKAQIWAERIT